MINCLLIKLSIEFQHGASVPLLSIYTEIHKTLLTFPFPLYLDSIALRIVTLQGVLLKKRYATMEERSVNLQLPI